MKLYDFHTHLNDPKLYSNWRDYLDNFIKNWWKWLVNIWVDDEWNNRAVEIANNIKDTNNTKCEVYATIGYHPSEICFRYNKDLSEDVSKWSSDDKFTKWVNKKLNILKKIYFENKNVIVWIGESWIDLHYPNWYETLKEQKQFFGLQCELAEELELPVVVHSRDAFNETFDVLKNFKNLKIYFHCWWYSPDEVKKVLKHFPNVWIWFAWNVTYPKANNLRESLKTVPYENLVLETDAPYLAPQIVRWHTNQPANVKYIYKFVSDFRNIEIEKLCDIMEKNFKALYNVITDNL